MIGTILLALALSVVTLLSVTYVVVQRRLRTLDEEAFTAWFMEAFLGMRPGESKMQESKQRELRAPGRKDGAKQKPRTAPARAEPRNQTEARPTS